MGEVLLPLIAGSLSKDRDACEMQRATAARELEVAKSRNEELRQELRSCEADKIAAQKAVSDAHARVRATRDALVLVERQSAVAAAVLMHKETQLSQCSDCCLVLQQQTRELEDQQKRVIEGAHREASILKSEVERLRKDVGQQDVLRSQIEHSRQEAHALLSSLENARANASAALSERDCLRRDFDNSRQRLFVAEKDASALRSEVSLAKASASSALAQLEDLRHELKLAKKFKNSTDEHKAPAMCVELLVPKTSATAGLAQLEDQRDEEERSPNLKSGCTSQAQILWANTDTTKSSCTNALRESDTLTKGLDAKGQELADLRQRIHKTTISNKDVASEKVFDASLHNSFAVADASTTALKSFVGVEAQIDRSESGESIALGKDGIIKGRHAEAASPKCTKRNVPMTVLGAKFVRSEPIQFHERKETRETSMPNSKDSEEKRNLYHQQQDNAQSQYKAMQKQHTVSSASPNPTQICRTKSRLWGPRSNVAAVAKRKKRGCIYRTDLEKVGYTPGCRGCEEAFNRADQPRSHTEACRSRIYAEMVRLNLPGARRLRDAELEMTGCEPKRPRMASHPSTSDASKLSGHIEVQQQVQVTQTTRSMISSMVRACAIK